MRHASFEYGQLISAVSLGVYASHAAYREVLPSRWKHEEMAPSSLSILSGESKYPTFVCLPPPQAAMMLYYYNEIQRLRNVHPSLFPKWAIIKVSPQIRTGPYHAIY